jgi:hypothetical protein
LSTLQRRSGTGGRCVVTFDESKRQRRRRGTGTVFYDNSIGLWVGQATIAQRPDRLHRRAPPVFGNSYAEVEAKLELLIHPAEEEITALRRLLAQTYARIAELEADNGRA